MTIRRQVVVAVVPVFAALALVASLVTYVLHRQAVLDGLRAQAGAFAVGLASMPTPEDVEAMIAGHVETTKIPKATERLARQEALTRVMIFDAVNETVLFRSAPDAALPLPRNVEAWDAGAYQVAPLYEPESGAARLTAFAPMATQAGELRLIVAAEIDASLFPREMAALRRRLWRTGLLIVAVGAMIALALSSVIARELRRLARAAEEIEHGKYTAPRAGAIAEVSELAQTFGVLDDVIGELRTKSQRAFAENEQFRTDQDLLRVYRETLLPTLDATRSGVRVVASVTPDAVGVFREWVQPGATNARLCFGRVIGDGSLQTATVASAAGRELADRLGRGESHADALAATARLFPLALATVLDWAAESDAISRTDWSSGELRTTEHRLGATGEAQVHHHLPVSTGATVDLYLKRFPAHPPVTCANDLVALAATGNSALVVLSRAT